MLNYHYIMFFFISKRLVMFFKLLLCGRYNISRLIIKIIMHFYIKKMIQLDYAKLLYV